MAKKKRKVAPADDDWVQSKRAFTTWWRYALIHYVAPSEKAFHGFAWMCFRRGWEAAKERRR